jgi:acyl-CoA synthetase (NDP forming)
MVGPNCLGILSTDAEVRLNASFAPTWPPAGSVAMASQSGALGLALLALARERGLGVSSFVSLGNKADVSSNDLIQYWEEDEHTAVILLYLESFGNPRRFAQLARRVARRKPIVVVKSGRSTSGRKAASSHTAALAASDVTVDALFHQTGVLRVDTLDEMFQVASALGTQPTPAGRSVAIVTNAGGPGILCADACEARGLVVPVLNAALRAEIASHLPAAASAANPVDMIASAGPDDYKRTLVAVLADEAVDAAIVIHVPAGIVPPETISEAIAQVADARRDLVPKPVLACMMPGEEWIARPIATGSGSVPTYPFPEQAAGALAAMADYRAWRDTPAGSEPELSGIRADAGRELCARALAERGPGWLTSEECARLLDAFGVPRVPTAVAHDAASAVRVAGELGYPVALKLQSTTVVHKTDVGGVRLGLANGAEVARAYDEIAAAVRPEDFMGVVVQQMVAGATEILIGATADPLFGPVLAFGLGGIHVEILRDVVFRVSPLTDRDAADMVRSIRGFALLQGYRGHAPADVPAIEEVLLRVSRLVQEIPSVAEIDLNPVFALQEGCLVADSRIRVEPAQ